MARPQVMAGVLWARPKRPPGGEADDAIHEQGVELDASGEGEGAAAVRRRGFGVKEAKDKRSS